MVSERNVQNTIGIVGTYVNICICQCIFCFGAMFNPRDTADCIGVSIFIPGIRPGEQLSILIWCRQDVLLA